LELRAPALIERFQSQVIVVWSRLIQAQGFGQRYEDATGASLGTATITGNPISRFITVRVSKASLCQPGPGWGFTVMLTGVSIP
jgi:hypothetical protein